MYVAHESPDVGLSGPKHGVSGIIKTSVCVMIILTELRVDSTNGNSKLHRAVLVGVFPHCSTKVIIIWGYHFLSLFSVEIS
jgi:hypothetical protein